MIKERIKDKAVRVCDECGDEKLVGYYNLLRSDKHLCYSCSNSKTNIGRSPHNKGVKQTPKNIGNTHRHSDKYQMVWVGKTNSKHGYMPVHRLLMSDHIGRPLAVEEKVHHIDGQKSNNSIENLLLCKNMSDHRHVHAQLERLSFELVKLGIIKFNFDTREYELSRPMEEFIEEKSLELLETPLEDNQQPSSAELAEKVQRLFHDGSTLK